MNDHASELAATDALLAAAQQAALARREVRRLRDIEQWALASLHLQDGDAAVLAEPVNATCGWAGYAEVLVVGRTGRVSSIYLNPHGEWCALFTPDDCWVLSDYRGERFATEPTSFMLRLRKLRKRTETDMPLPVPDGISDRYMAKAAQP